MVLGENQARGHVVVVGNNDGSKLLLGDCDRFS